MVTIKKWARGQWKDSYPKNIKKPLVDKLLFGNLKSGGQISLDIKNGSIKFSEVKKKIKA